MKRIGFLVNPIAGMGGRVGLKGTDGVLEKAQKLGARSVAVKKAAQALDFMREVVHIRHERFPVRILTCAGKMGEESLKKAGFGNGDYEIAYSCREATSAADTKKACKRFLKENVELVLFCGGDGTARDVLGVVGAKIPILGIPSGVKMHSAVFGVNAQAAAELVVDFSNERASLRDAEVMDVDEKAYRRGEWKVRVFGYARTPYEAAFIQGGKLVIQEPDEDEMKKDIAAHVVELMEREKGTLFILGPGSTVEAVAKALGAKKTIMGVDAVLEKRLIAKDLNEKALLSLLEKHERTKLVLSPIGAQGFVLGRGNLQISPAVVKKIGIENIVLISTPSKLRQTPALRVDTGNDKLDHEFAKSKLFVINGYHSVALRTIERAEGHHRGGRRGILINDAYM